MAPKRPASNSRAQKDTTIRSEDGVPDTQQGAQGRLEAEPPSRPVLVPRSSKVPAQDSDVLTTAQGVQLQHTDDSLKAGRRGPTLLEDQHLREKIMHFDHERIPERVVHARGAAAHGVFEAYGNVSDITSADFLQPGRLTPVFTRFSTVVGSRDRVPAWRRGSDQGT